MTLEPQPPTKLTFHAGLFANPQTQLVFAGAFASIAAVLLVVSYLRGPGTRVLVGLVLAAVLIVVNTDRLWPTRVLLDDDGVSVKLPFSRAVYPWSSIRAVSTSGLGVVLALRDGANVTIRTHADAAPQGENESEGTKRLADAVRARLLAVSAPARVV